MNVINKIKKMKIDIRTKDCLYIEMNNKVFYIDDSTNEAIIDVFTIEEAKEYKETIKQIKLNNLKLKTNENK